MRNILAGLVAVIGGIGLYQGLEVTTVLFWGGSSLACIFLWTPNKIPRAEDSEQECISQN